MNPDLELLDRLPQPFAGDLAFGVNPLSAALHTRLLTYDRAAGLMRISFAPPPAFRETDNRISRATASILIDFPVGIVGLSRLEAGQAPASTRFSLLFIDASGAERFIATGRVLGRRDGTLFTQGELHDEHGTLCATAHSTVAVVRLGARPQRRG